MMCYNNIVTFAVRFMEAIMEVFSGKKRLGDGINVTQ